MRGRAVIMLTIMCWAALSLGSAFAQSNDGSEPPQPAVVKGKIITKAPKDVVLPAPPETLPFTGAEVSSFIVLGLASLTTGIVLVRFGRRIRTPGATVIE